MKRILIICNKSWETDAALSAIFNDDIRHSSFDYNSNSKKFDLIYAEFPRTHAQGDAQPRAIFQTDKYSFEIWSIQNIMTPNPDPNDYYYYSRSLQKAKDFPKILTYSTDEIQLIIAFGTAGVPSEVSKNGGVVLGSNVFVYDAASPQTTVKYENPNIGQLIRSGLPDDFFDQLNINISKIEMKLYFETTALMPAINPANSFQLFADKSIVAVSNVNVASYADYKSDDQLALKEFANLKVQPIAYSVETTHGLIRLESNFQNFMFVSAITDRDAYFDYEVTPKVHAQNFTSAFNGGIFLSWLIPFIQDYNFH